MKTTWVKVLIFSIPLFIAGVGYALTQVSFNNTSIIVGGQNILITQPTFNMQACPASGDAAYKNGGFGQLTWTLTQGGAPIPAFFCIDNQGTSPDAPSVTHSASITDGPCPSTTNALTWASPTQVPGTLPAHTATALPIVISVCAGSQEPVATNGPSFTVTVT